MRILHLIARPMVVVVVLLGIAGVLRAEAQCTFESSPKAKKLDFSFVRALEECPGIAHPAPNVMLDTIPACTPPIAESAYSFGSNGTCDMRILHKAGKSCATPPCSELTLKAKCRDVIDGTSSPTNGEAGWRLRMYTSVTQVDVADHPFTYTQVPVEFEFPPSDNGKLSLTLTSSELAIQEFLGWPPLPLARCASVQFSPRLNVAILDPAGDRFALPGTTVASAAPICGIHRVSRAKGLKGASLVRVFVDECEPTPPPPYVQCESPTPLSSRRFDDERGACKIALSQEIAPCASDPSVPCAPVAVTLKCNGLQDAGGLPLNESGWHLDLELSGTLNDGVVDATVITLPVRIDLPPIVDGKVALDVSRIDLADPVDVTLEIPACSVLALYDAGLFDADDGEFARLGTAAFPK